MFDRILIANRGEIARRVIRTARRMGVETVAVYSDADAAAPHAREADAARRIGPAPAAESYLRGEAILEAARATGAQAVHPGYGFLSENAAFAEACAAAGIAFIGPKPHSIRAMGDKAASKRAMRAAGVPLAPGYDGEDQATGLLADEAARIGFPVMIKASAGGGGKGMRIVGAAGEFEAALEGCRREAAGAFGDERVLIEKFIERPRHVEVQVFADAHGSVAHLFDRDCSAQRRHQKVIEEAPAPDVPEAVAAAMRQAAIDAARAVDYLGAGTVEFLLGADGGFYFMEMNTRLQVEHPVTEMVTGLDLVEWQLRVAAGEPLPLGQDEIALRGHAIEARLYAEDPDRDFLPAVGRLAALRFPPEDGAALRIDAGVREGDAVSPFYDPMIAKLISHGPDRETARATLLKALRASLVAGVTTNRGFLARLLATDDFREGRLDTGLIARNAETLARPARALGADGAAERALAAAALWDAPSPGARGDAGAF
ncbi:MAG: biotin carboxylase N-terminal domain-containing protein, partial [Pseudomonadota bacterium]